MLDTVHCFTLKTPSVGSGICVCCQVGLGNGGTCPMGPLARANAISWINHTDGAWPQTPHFGRECINLKPSKKLTKFLYHTDVKGLQTELILGVYEVR